VQLLKFIHTSSDALDDVENSGDLFGKRKAQSVAAQRPQAGKNDSGPEDHPSLIPIKIPF